MELWQTHPYHTDYEVSSVGRVRSNKKQTSKILKAALTGEGYNLYCLSTNGQKFTSYAHRLVLETFQPQTNSSELEANHKNKQRSDNRIENLEWVTRKQNSAHSRLWNPELTDEEIRQLIAENIQLKQERQLELQERKIQRQNNAQRQALISYIFKKLPNISTERLSNIRDFLGS